MIKMEVSIYFDPLRDPLQDDYHNQNGYRHAKHPNHTVLVNVFKPEKEFLTHMEAMGFLNFQIDP